MPNPPIDSLASLLSPFQLPIKYCLRAKFRRQIIFSDDTYRFIADVHNRVQVFSIGAVLIMVYPKRFLSRNVKVLHTSRASSFRFSQKIDMTASKLDIPPINAIHLVVDGGKIALILCSIWFSNSCPIHDILRSSRFPTLSTSATTMEMSDSGYLAMDLFYLHVFDFVERFPRYWED